MGFDYDPAFSPQVIRALNESGLGEFATPSGIETLVGENGSKLSGGQRQRLGIARSLFTNPSLLVLDEATSAVDAETEKLVSDWINTLKGKVTVITVAHRLSTVRTADLVVYVQNGKIVAIGTFDQIRSSVSNFDTQAKLMGL
jgi:ABC-type bacteriocin/lantibiotic exporter with double-glycine peptidase domain